MGPSKLRKAIGAVKDKTSIGLAKVNSSTALAELEVAIVKATRHDEYPAEEKHVRDILSLTSYSRVNVSSAVALLSRRLGKTRSWAVALKTLILVHRLLSDGDPAYEEEVFFTTRRGTRMLNMADFRDAAGNRSGGWDYSAFVRTYARYLDERLEYKMIGRRQKPRGGWLGEWKMAKAEEGVDEVDEGGEEARSTPFREMPNDRVFTRAQHLQVLLDRFLASRPTGAAKTNRIVAMALYPMVKESFQIYFDLTEITVTLVDRFMELPVPESIRVHELFSKLSKQLEELDSFYSWSRSAGVSRASDYPEIEHITQKRLDVMDDFIRERSALPQSHAASEGASTVELKTPADDTDTVKALPAPPPPIEEAKKEKDEGLQEEKELASSALVVVVAEQVQPTAAEQEVDFLNLRAGEPTTEQHADSLALVLFDGGTTSAMEVQPWDAFRKTADWEKALVESASNLAGQKPALGGGLDMLMLDGMYTQPQAVARGGADGSASSLAVMGPTHSVTLALPTPPGQGGGAKEDPFAPSAAVPPPSWVQMSDMEKKQHLLMEEQILWQQYARDGMQGKLPSVYSVGGYTYRL